MFSSKLLSIEKVINIDISQAEVILKVIIFFINKLNIFRSLNFTIMIIKVM